MLERLFGVVAVVFVITGCGGMATGNPTEGPGVDAGLGSQGTQGAGMDAGAGSQTTPGQGGIEAGLSPLDASDLDAGPSGQTGPVVSSACGSSAAPGACQPKFASGLNLAWVNYARDVPNPNLAMFDTVFNNTYASGGRVVRWWFHVNGQSTPGYDTDGNALPLTCAQADDVRSILDHAAAAKVMVLISLWSFNMLDGTNPPTLLANNMNLLVNDSNRQAYIDNYLKPLVAAVGGHPGLYGWELFNEPEGMSNVAHYTARPADGGASPTVNESFIQTTINWFADAIHRVDPGALVTSGTWEFAANSNAAGMKNYYSDSALLAAGARDAGVLDFYEVHYYAADGVQNSPFKNAASNWKLDKPVVIGEFDAIDTDGVDAGDLYTTLDTTGYGGAWAWKYLIADDAARNNAWPAMQLPMQNAYALDPNGINCP